MAIDVKPYTVNLGGKPYVQVNGRVLLAHDDNKEVLSITTEKTKDTADVVEFKATVVTRKGVFTGHAESDKKAGKGVEKESPVEVAETSAVGRALAFAGYAIAGGIASAEEVEKAQAKRASVTLDGREVVTIQPATKAPTAPKKMAKAQVEDAALTCADCGNDIQAVTTGEGTLDAQAVANSTQRVFKRALCEGCAKTAQAPKVAG
jgi:hypothetical protein